MSDERARQAVDVIANVLRQQSGALVAAAAPSFAHRAESLLAALTEAGLVREADADPHDAAVMHWGIALSGEVTRLLKFRSVDKWLGLLADLYPGELAACIASVRATAEHANEARIERVQAARAAADLIDGGTT